MSNLKSYPYTKHLLFLIFSTIAFTFVWFQSTAMMTNKEESFLSPLSESLIIESPLKSKETSLGVSIDIDNGKIYREVLNETTQESETQSFRLKDFYNIKNHNRTTIKELVYEHKTHQYFITSLIIIYILGLIISFVLIILKHQAIKNEKKEIY